MLGGSPSIILPRWCKRLKLAAVIVGAIVDHFCWIFEQHVTIEDKCRTLLMVKLN
jgi:hypothetical protein